MRLITLVTLILSVLACSSVAVPNGTSQWDFDHNVQFKQTKLSEYKYHLEVVAKLDTHFSQLATFMVRRAYDICNSYGYTIEVLKGVEAFDDRRSFPNLIMSSLSVNITCK